MHWHNVELAAALDPTFAIDHQSEFSAGQAVHVRDLKCSDERDPARLDQRAFHAQAAERIRSIQDDELNPIFRRCFHAFSHGADVGVTAAANILQIEDKRIDSAQHCRGRFACRSVERIGDQASQPIASGRYITTSLLGPV